MNEQNTHRIRIDLAYDGTPYHGWATQPGLPTVQEAVEAGLATILRQAVNVTVAGRTDAGVHAANQVIHCDVEQTQWQNLMGNRRTRPPEQALVSKLNGVLAQQAGAIRILAAEVVPKGFDARFSPISRQYRYRINNGTPDPLTRHFTYQHRRPLSFETMADEIADIQGFYDFGSFCKPRAGATTLRTLHRFDLDVTQECVNVWLAADAFCHHMVRALVGALVQVGDGTRPQGWLQERLANPVRDSHMMLAPALGLILDSVTYPSYDEVTKRAQQTRAKRAPTCWSCD